MSFISYSDCPISINGENFYALSASISSNTQLVPNRVMGGELESYSPVGPLASKLAVDYYVTGKNEKILFLTGDVSCSGSFGGIEFSGAYMTDYSVSIMPYNPIIISSRFDIFSGHNKTLSSSSYSSTGIDVANATKVDLGNFNYDNLGFRNPIGIDFGISCERIPNYVIGSEFPQDIRLGKVTKSMGVLGENIGEIMTYEGKNTAQMSITPKTINNLSRGQTLTCSGVIQEQNISVSSNDQVNGRISIIEEVR
tara:strand:+ start:4574 stop:5335 length:762 start_codon:yes stop_codon:yes gene_type:complete